jgi:tRNA nucleotidyltransferase (CCA-adding enzyme)
LYALNEADVLAKGRDASADLLRIVGLRQHVERVLAAGAALSVRELAINGHDLIQGLGLEPGRAIGELLGKLLEVVIEHPELNERSALLERARAIVAEQALP